MDTPGSTRRGTGLRGRRRSGGAAAGTRAQILEAAGAVFAEKGFDRATGKEIARRAGCNSAAINYHFGGIDGLYGEVLVEAHRRLVAYDALAAIARGEGDARDKLRRLTALVVRTITGTGATSWALRVLSREVLAPTPLFDVLRDRELLPKRRVVTGIVAGILELPEDHPVVARCCLSILAPCVMLLVGDRRVAEQLLPGLDTGPMAAEALADHLLRFALGGIAAVAEGAARRAAPAEGG